MPRFGEVDIARKEPAWWADARRMRAEGLSYYAIAARVGRSYTAVRHALDERARNLNRQRVYAAVHAPRTTKADGHKFTAAEQAMVDDLLARLFPVDLCDEIGND